MSSSFLNDDLRVIAGRAADLLRHLPYWSILLEDRDQLSTAVQRGSPVAPARQRLRAALLTLGVGQNVSYASTTDLSERGLRKAILAAEQRAEALSPSRLLDRDQWPMPVAKGVWQLPAGQELSLAERYEYLRALDAATQIDPRISDREIVLTSILRQRYFLHCAGAEQRQETSLCLPYLDVTASDGSQVQRRSFSPSMQGAMTFSYLQEAKFTTATATRLTNEAVELLHAPECPSGCLDLLLSPAQMTLQIHESIGHPLELDRILGDERNYAGWSFVTPEDFGSLQYGSPLLNVVFDPYEAGELAGFAFDDEGTSAQREHLIRDGILQRPLGGARSAARSNFSALACSRICDPLRPPIDRMANVNMEPGEESLEAMIASVEHGVWMDENRSWSIDQRRDKFQFGCEWGRLIVNGTLGGWVKNPNYRGRTLPFWNSLSAVGNRETYRIGGAANCGKGEPNQAITVGHASPACLFRNIEIFGGAA
ncbi:TldD/PmbA family protein [Acidithiobacillus sp. CV18-2]|uniref:TldD/PmbA family protein n=1 Tax=Igneacidithiobacillus copahuensis TaxID=2724909 RepID=A0AAE2YME2_9PROT|nr:TldD/PmbA family protein [Igneacidithiobacillus copahuensis]MBU2754084.1 TldD/PmbA family protein [Acidithiobacillus sp. CV18-3]MBU2755842.1 TldD/PmbA family protein [Acidithiobacillus sp. BN09-2]MBU2776564.1 TldD/PmbA family protein [Acidithiobacillus sp. CV18-2]MBU2797740.1 TldD/PmbA family protein [Acidithiobacillus sp. VAN18-2]MBU2798582.1 TldD/PmbA family protein [Acidithiobacillus sp. VAN18-4]